MTRKRRLDSEAIRRATPADAGELLEIYRPIVENTVVSFEHSPPSVETLARRIESALDTHEWLVMQTPRGLVGYAYASAHRPREAYRFAVETSVYVHSQYRQRGVAKRLYAALFAALKDTSFHNAYAGIALPNDASLALHAQLGFEPIGVFREVGYKFGAWHDVSWWQRAV